MKKKITKFTVITSLLWRIMERVGTQAVQFIVQIILARLLLPNEFGLIILVTIFIALANVLVQSGFNTALIQKKDVDEIDFSSVFYLNLLLAGILYSTIYFTSPLLAYFFDEPKFVSILRVLSLTLFISVFMSIQNVIISRNMQFKKLFFSSIGAILISSIVGISMAYGGFGVWALVVQQMINQFVAAIILWLTVKWKPQVFFSLERLKQLFSYSWKLLIASLIDTIYINMRSLFIGKIFSPTMLGFYNRGEQIPNLVVGNVNGSIQSVMLPALAAYQDDTSRVKEIMRRAIITSSFFIFPMMTGLYVVAEPFIKLLLTEKWMLAVPFLKIFCVSYALWPIHTANLQAINALGRSDVSLKLEIIKKTIGLIILVISIPMGVYTIAIGFLITSIISSFINAFPNKKLLNYSFYEQVLDILPSLILSVFMGGILSIITIFDNLDALNIAIKVIIGVVFYLGLAKLFRLESFSYLLQTGRVLIYKKRQEK